MNSEATRILIVDVEDHGIESKVPEYTRMHVDLPLHQEADICEGS